MNRMYQEKCPYNTHDALADWASKRFKNPKSRYNKMSKKQLYAIFYNCLIQGSLFLRSLDFKRRPTPLERFHKGDANECYTKA